jgi:hypothetical protein
VNVRNHQKQIEHALAFVRVGLGCSLLQILHDGQSVRQKQGKRFRVDVPPLPAAIQRLVRSVRCSFEKMLEAETFPFQSEGNGSAAPFFAADFFVTWIFGSHWRAPQTMGNAREISMFSIKWNVNREPFSRRETLRLSPQDSTQRENPALRNCRLKH